MLNPQLAVFLSQTPPLPAYWTIAAQVPSIPIVRTYPPMVPGQGSSLCARLVVGPADTVLVAPRACRNWCADDQALPAGELACEQASRSKITSCYSRSRLFGEHAPKILSG